MAGISQDSTLARLLAQHLRLIKEPIPYKISMDLAKVHILNRCSDLLVDLLLWKGSDDFQEQLYTALHKLYQQQDLSAEELRARMVVLLEGV